jgi:tRNA nucleotidyltransferase (CCA-adding enzyme)
VKAERIPLRLDAPDEVVWLVSTLENRGFDTWAVGGAVRDALRGVGSTDWDFATRASPTEVQRIFRRTVPLGLAHGTVGVLDRKGVMHEVTTFRKDVETDGRHAVIAFASRIEDDLARRDFTINALAWHPIRRELLDPFNGRADLAAGVLRTVGRADDRFAEDYLRVLRALRFAGRFGLRIEESTWVALCDAAPRVVDLSPERIREELLKVLADTAPPSRALRDYRRAGVWAAVAVEIEAVEGGAWQATLDEVDALPPHDPWLRLAALLARVGQPPARVGDPGPEIASGVRAFDSEAERAVVRTVALLLRLRVSNAQLDRVTGWVAQGLRPPDTESGPSRRRWLARVGPARLAGYADLWRCRHEAHPDDFPDPSEAIRALYREVEAEPPLDVGALAVSGRDLIAAGLRPSPRFGEILSELLEVVLDDPEQNTRASLLPRLEALATAAASRP